MAKVVEPNANINMHFKDDTIRIMVDVPGVETMGVFNKKPDPSKCSVDVTFADNQVALEAKIHTGTKAGITYKYLADKDDLNVPRIMPHPASTYKVKKDLVELYVRKR